MFSSLRAWGSATIVDIAMGVMVGMGERVGNISLVGALVADGAVVGVFVAVAEGRGALVGVLVAGFSDTSAFVAVAATATGGAPAGEVGVTFSFPKGAQPANDRAMMIKDMASFFTGLNSFFGNPRNLEPGDYIPRPSEGKRS